MPRPGPRPYECVRRAWHSERHQPMRGLIIQQILRLVHENHSAATKKNREWQEKLPVVVFKAEEIMYSKANSEAEYSNAETLWERVNDAVDTIIRRDESTEIGELLLPCIEAALNLGCVPVRASRSQRLNNPRTYLRPAYQEFGHLDKSNLMPSQTSNDSMRKAPNVGSPRVVWENNAQIMPNANRRVDSLAEKFCPVGNRNNMELEDNSNKASVYPLYHGIHLRRDAMARPLVAQELLKSDPIIVGVPIYSSPEVAENGCLQNLFPGGLAEEKWKLNTADGKGKEPHVDFDLSLRLGLFSESNTDREKGLSRGSYGVHDAFSHEMNQSKEGFPFFPMEPAHGSVDLDSRKRKLPFKADVENDQIFWSRDSTFHFAGQWKSRGL
ncbi:uncharacterized protein LOC127265078 [Andrographis paniculata]|uniref:uncharacterized protein LOC127265078 n=1 Tax=Andrographis paniculata TaxID=175694 RepID=UPI0021E86D71|nr:uncharacterized protein LOC127265078 [Andrographis paniculata]